MKRSRIKAQETLVKSLLSEAREELGRADNKTSILLAAAGVVVGALTAAVLAGDWSPTKLAPGFASIWWIGCGFLSAGILCLGIAIYPRTSRPRKVPNFVAYFGDVVALKSRANLNRAISKTARAAGTRDLDQLELVSAIVSKKYRFLRLALLSFALGALLLALVAALTTVGG